MGIDFIFDDDAVPPLSMEALIEFVEKQHHRRAQREQHHHKNVDFAQSKAAINGRRDRQNRSHKMQDAAEQNEDGRRFAGLRGGGEMGDHVRRIQAEQAQSAHRNQARRDAVQQRRDRHELVLDPIHER